MTAAQTGTRAIHGTTTDAVADKITLVGVEEYVEILNHSDTVILYFTHRWGKESVNSVVATAVSGADETHAVHPRGTSRLIARSDRVSISVVGTANPYSVQSI